VLGDDLMIVEDVVRVAQGGEEVRVEEFGEAVTMASNETGEGRSASHRAGDWGQEVGPWPEAVAKSPSHKESLGTHRRWELALADTIR
jgi:hypothetical protein